MSDDVRTRLQRNVAFQTHEPMVVLVLFLDTGRQHSAIARGFSPLPNIRDRARLTMDRGETFYESDRC